MEWSEGDNWFLEVDLFPGITDFKCAVVRQDGSVACWEPGANRTVEVNTRLQLDHLPLCDLLCNITPLFSNISHGQCRPYTAAVASSQPCILIVSTIQKLAIAATGTGSSAKLSKLSLLLCAQGYD